MALQKIGGMVTVYDASIVALCRWECPCGTVIDGRRDSSNENGPTVTVCDGCGTRYRIGMVVWFEDNVPEVPCESV